MKNYIRDYFLVLGDANKKLPWIILLLLFSAVLDTLGLSLIAPLIAAVTNTPKDLSNFPLLNLIPIKPGGPGAMFSILGSIVIAVFAIKAVVTSYMQFIITRFSENHRRNLMSRLLTSYLQQPYEFHLKRSSTSLITSVVSFTSYYAGGTLEGSLRLAADGLIFLVIGAFLAWTDWQAVLLLLGLIGTLFVAYNLGVRKWVRRSGAETAMASEQIARMVGDAVGPIREVRLFGVEQHFVSGMDHYAASFAYWSAIGASLQSVPRYLVEVMMVVFLVTISLFAVHRNLEASDIIQVLGVFGVAALRLMPASTSLITGINNLRQSRFVLGKLAEDLSVIGTAPAAVSAASATAAPIRPLQDFAEIRFNHVSYAYPGTSRDVVDKLSFTLKKGQAIGVIGRTGTGKSTCADLLLGFLAPRQGAILVDGNDIHADLPAWQQRLAYIPQSVFLTNDTLLRNVAFGVADADVDRVRLEAALESSMLKEVVEGLTHGIDTLVGERGVSLSGGQRQRVALARALYHDREIIVMDEATSALDAETEAEVVRAIERLHGKKTLVIIAHRLSTLKGCDAILNVENGDMMFTAAAQHR